MRAERATTGLLVAAAQGNIANEAAVPTDPSKITGLTPKARTAIPPGNIEANNPWQPQVQINFKAGGHGACRTGWNAASKLGRTAAGSQLLHH